MPILLILFGGVFLGALDIAIVGPALPAIQAELSLSARQVASIFSVYILFGLVSAPLLASLSDTHGRRRVYVACLAAFALGSIIVATAASIEVLLLGRAVQAIGAGGTLPVASAVIADTYPVERRGRALGLIGSVFGIAFVLGPVIGAIFLRWSWRWLFLVNLPLVIVLLTAAIARLEDRVRSAPVPFDWSGAVLMALGLVALAIGATSIGASGPLGIGPVSAVAFGFALVLLYLFWRVETRSTAPIVNAELLGSTQMRIIGLLGFATGVAEAGMVFLPSLAVSALSVAPSRASFMLLPLVGALIAGSIIAGRTLDRVGAKPVIQVGMLLTVTGLVLFGLLPLDAINFYAAGIAVGFGLAALLGAPLRFAALEVGGEMRRGASQGLLTICLSSGRLFGASLTGGIAAGATGAALGYRRSMLVIAVAGAAALILSTRLRR